VNYKIRRRPAFATLFITLDPGESVIAEAGAMISMPGKLTMKTAFSGNFGSALLRKFLGGESLFINTFTNPTQEPLELVLTQSNIGDMTMIELKGRAICLQPGAFVALTPGVTMGIKWAGFSSWLAGEGLFKLQLSGRGLVFVGAYGGISRKRVSGEFIVDSGHLVAYEPEMQMRIGLAGGGLFRSVTSGEGLINRLKGEGVIYLQSRSVEGLVRYLRTKL
jgi:uncharacterized protein (TIGR00266 family)